MTGCWLLMRLAVRRDRIALPAWVLGIAGMMVFAGQSVKSLYTNQSDLDKFAAAVGDNPALVAIRGRTYGIDTMGGAIAWQLGYFAMILAALMSLLLVVRHTRGDEETDRLELVLAGPVGRLAPLVAALAVVAGANVAISVVTTLGMVAIGLPFMGSAVLGASIGAVGLVFAGIAAVTAQLSTTARGASGLAGALLGVAYVIRAVGDVADNGLSWLSPIGWGLAAHPYAGDRWWPLLLAVPAVAIAIWTAHLLLERRDYGAGVLAPGPGSPTASVLLLRPLGFAVRLQRGVFAAWAVGLFALGIAYGALAHSIRDLLKTIDQAQEIFVQHGGVSIVDSFFGTIMVTLALIGTCFTIQAISRIRSEETSGHAEPVLATALSRIRWAGSHLAVSLGGTLLLLAAAGGGAGLAYGISGPGLGQVPRLLGAALVQAPAAWVLGGVTLVLVGFLPRLSVLAWLPLTYCFVIGSLGPLLGLPDWMLNVSPYALVPQVPAEAFSAGPLIWLTVVAAALAATGLIGLRRRDIG